MSEHPVDSEDDRGPEEGAADAEPARVVVALFFAAVEGEITPKQASEQVRQRELAQAVTADTVPGLARVLAKVEESCEAKITEFFADLLMDFAGALSKYRRIQAAVDLYSVAESVYLRLNCEMDVARCRVNRANTLLSIGRYPEAVAGYDSGSDSGPADAEPGAPCAPCSWLH